MMDPSFPLRDDRLEWGMVRQTAHCHMWQICLKDMVSTRLIFILKNQVLDK